MSKNNILCGSACVKYILKKYNKKNNINNEMLWISQLTLCLYERNLKNLKLLCYKSNLYNDYINKLGDQNFEGFKFLREISNIISIEEKALNKTILKEEILYNEFIILCVESKKFNNDNSISGGHFIILNGFKDDRVNVINPIKDKYEFITKTLDELIYYCENYGSWRLLIKGE